MENEKLNKGIEQIKKIKMTDAEKNQILLNIQNTPLPIKAPIKSPWTIYYSFFVSLSKKRMAYYAIATCLIIIISGREIVYASTDSLPGDALYEVKVNIIEPLHTALTFSGVAKAEYESRLAEKRLIEAETLASENKLDETKQEKINSLLEKHTRKLNKELEKLSADNTSDDVDNISINFQAGMNAHARVLDIINSNEESDIKVEVENDNAKVAKKARDSGAKVRDNLKNKEENKDKYTKRKVKIQSLIDETSVNLNNNNTNSSNPNQSKTRRQKIIENTGKTIDEARGYLKKADEEDNKQDFPNAYNSLLDSESRAKEADILLKTGLNIEVRGNKLID